MNKSSLCIIDNFLDTDEFNKLSTFVLGQKFPWFYGEHVSIDPNDAEVIKDPLAMETWGFHHIVFEKEWSIKSFTYDTLTPLFQKMEKELGFTQNHLIRVRMSIKFQKQGFTSNNYNMPHVDYYYPHETLILYLNDSDGDTRIFNEWSTYTGKGTAIGPETFTTQARVTPKANRLIWFNGLQYHTASNPIEETKRAIININLEPR